MENRVKNLWWEDDDLFIEHQDGKIYCFENAYIKNIKYNYKSDENSINTIRITDLPIEFNGIKICCSEKD